MPDDTLTTIITTTAVTIVATVIANQLSKSSAVERISQLTGKMSAKIAKFIMRFGVNIGILMWCAWVMISFGLKTQPIERFEILGLIYFSFMAAWFVGDTLAEISKIRRN